MNHITYFYFNSIRRHHGLENQYLTTGCDQLDKALGGGLYKCGIIEVSGESGCGKTQLCLQIALTVQLPLSLNGAKSGRKNQNNFVFIWY